jgi:toxin ParE1/3/4
LEQGASSHYKELLAKHFAMIQANPSIGQHHKPGLEEGILCVRAGRHLIFYETQNETVVVLRILHDSMDYTQHLN